MIRSQINVLCWVCSSVTRCRAMQWLAIVFLGYFVLADFAGARCPQAAVYSPLSEDRETTLERFLYQARLADGETALLVELDNHPTDDDVRFSIGIIQFFRALENAGQALYEYGAFSERLSEPLLRLKVPQNHDPSELSEEEFGRFLDAFKNDLLKAEHTLSQIKDDRVKIPIKLAKVALRISSTSDEVITLTKWMQDIRIDVPAFLARNPELEIRFDRGDVAWLRAYCHAICGLIELYRSIDELSGFEDRFRGVFPRLKPTKKNRQEPWFFSLEVKDSSRLRRMREHLVAVCQLNQETWKHIRMETDDDMEWLSHPAQTDQLGIPITNEQIDAWLSMMSQVEGLLQGDRLIPGQILKIVNSKYTDSDGLNLRKVFDDPPKDLFNITRIQSEGFNETYIERDSKKPPFDMNAIMTALRLFDGPFGFVQAARLN